MSPRRIALSLSLAAVATVLCCTAPLRFITIPDPRDESDRPLSFDLVPRGYDDNGFALNPEMGWSYEQRCQPDAGRTSSAFLDCSWRFMAAADRPDGSTDDTRAPCTSALMDPDLGNDFSTLLALTCSDSPLRFMGHVNWGAFFGGAVTYQGELSWEEFSGNWPNDHDLNFTLALDGGSSPGRGPQWEQIHVEIERDEIETLRSPFWSTLLRTLKYDLEGVPKRLGERRPAVVTGLLGIDAEHVTQDNPNLELHPFYAMAVDVPLPAGVEAGAQRWAMLVRTTGNEGLCSHWWRRDHAVPLLGGKHTFRLPWSGNDTDAVSIDCDRTVFCGDPNTQAPITVRQDREHRAIAVDVPLRQGEMVEGDLVLRWSDAGTTARDAVQICSGARVSPCNLQIQLEPSRELLPPEPSTCAEPKPVISKERRRLLHPGRSAIDRE